MNDPLYTTSIGLALAFAFISGMNDGGTVVATIISSRSMSALKAIALAACSQLVGVLLLGTAVALTMMTGILRPEVIDCLPPRRVQLIMTAGLSAALIWQLFTWYVRLPSSGSHALVGGLLGAGFVALGIEGINHQKILKSVVAPMFISPLVGSVMGFMMFLIIRKLFSRAHRSIGRLFARAQTPTLMFLAASQGSNDSQKFMGVIGIILAAGTCPVGALPEIPRWVILSCAGAATLGLLVGGIRIVKTVGYGIYKLEPAHSFSSQLSASSILLSASVLGGPVSTTQVIASSVLGVGAAARFTGVRWPTAVNMAYAWLFTLPMTALAAAGMYLLLRSAVPR